MNRRLIVEIPLAALMLALTAGATTLVRMNLDELAKAAQIVARVRCVSSEARWDRGEIWTFTTFEALETLKGSVPRQITVRLIGGRVSHLKSTVDGVPRFAPGEEVYLFLEPTSLGELSVTSWVQGTFRVRRDPASRQEFVTQDTGSVTVFDPVTRQFKPGGARNLPVDQFRRLVLLAVERQRAVR